MTEAEWLDPSLNPGPVLSFRINELLEHLRDTPKISRSKRGKRKLRLFACACFRRWWPKLTERTRQLVELEEKRADDQAALTTVPNKADPAVHYLSLDASIVFLDGSNEIDVARNVTARIAGIVHLKQIKHHDSTGRDQWSGGRATTRCGSFQIQVLRFG